MKITKERVFLKTLLTMICISFVLFPAVLTAAENWVGPIPVANKSGHFYFKPEIGFSPSGAVYIVYREKDPAGNSDIILCFYDGKTMTYQNVSNGASFFGGYRAYESDLSITEDGKVHVAWTIFDRNAPGVHHVKYRYLDGTTWSPIINLHSVNMRTDDDMMDLRVEVDSKGNVHCVYQEEVAMRCWYVAKYGATVLPPVALQGGAQTKHPDLAVDDNYVHAIWMYKIGFPYTINYQKWENKINGARGPVQQLTFPKGESSSQKSRIDLDSQGFLHFAEFYKTDILKKLKYYKELPGGGFTTPVNVTDPNNLMLYHWAALEVKDNSIFTSVQLGGSLGGDGLFYNWQKNGVWGGYAGIPNTGGCVHQSADLSADGQIAAIAYGVTESAIMLVSTAPISDTGGLKAEFTTPSHIFAGSAATFDASQCVTLNPTFQIASYEWAFGDGVIQSTGTSSITHNYSIPGQTVPVSLKITATTGQMGRITKDVQIHALYSGLITAITSKRIRTLLYNRMANLVEWTANPKNVAAGYPTIVSYEIWRAIDQGVVGNPQFQLLGQVDANVNRFLDYQGVEENVRYMYAIVSVDSAGHKSPYSNQ